MCRAIASQVPGSVQQHHLVARRDGPACGKRDGGVSGGGDAAPHLHELARPSSCGHQGQLDNHHLPVLPRDPAGDSVYPQLLRKAMRERGEVAVGMWEERDV